MTMQYEIIPGGSGQLLESPVWDNTNNTISWVDIISGTIFKYNPGLGITNAFQVGQQIGAIAIKRSGGYIAALQNGFAEIDVEMHAVTMIADPEAGILGNRFNDGKCDPAGRFWAGTMSSSGEKSRGSLYVLNGDFSIETKIHDVSCSNGMAWSKDSSTFFYIDSPTQQVAAYNYDIVSGTISSKRIVIEIPVEDGMPDGMTIDSEGMLWIALWGGAKVQRWNPGTGKLVSAISLPCSNITSCSFGGPTLGDLYITSARTGLFEEQLKAQPLAGSLFVLKNCGHVGLPAYVYNNSKLSASRDTGRS
jgi:sugar lactone lactonase YvrE